MVNCKSCGSDIDKQNIFYAKARRQICRDCLQGIRKRWRCGIETYFGHRALEYLLSEESMDKIIKEGI